MYRRNARGRIDRVNRRTALRFPWPHSGKAAVDEEAAGAAADGAALLLRRRHPRRST